MITSRCEACKNLCFACLKASSKPPVEATTVVTQEEKLDIFKKVINDRITMIEEWNVGYMADGGKMKHFDIITNNTAEILALKIAIKVADKVFGDLT